MSPWDEGSDSPLVEPDDDWIGVELIVSERADPLAERTGKPNQGSDGRVCDTTLVLLNGLQTNTGVNG